MEKYYKMSLEQMQGLVNYLNEVPTRYGMAIIQKLNTLEFISPEQKNKKQDKKTPINK